MVVDEPAAKFHNEPAAQLHLELQFSIQDALKRRPLRPIIHKLNDDSSHLLQIPKPESSIRRGGRIYLNILIDPWFTGGQSDIASWFSQQYHATRSAVQSIAELEDLIRRVERLASSERTGNILEDAVEEDTSQAASLIDVVAVSHAFTDHCHRDTLLEVHRDVPVFAFAEAAALITSWNHFRQVVPVSTVPADEPFDWRSSSTIPLPEWLGICRIQQTEDRFNYHSALLITFNNRHGNSSGNPVMFNLRNEKTARHKSIEPTDDDENAEAVIYTPHGVHYADFEVLAKAVPSVSTLLFLHGLHNVRVGTVTGGVALQLNLGSHNGLKAQRILKASYWIGTHDEVKKGGGLVSWFLQRDSLTLKDALDLERQTQRRKGRGSKVDSELEDVLDSFDDASFAHLANGESRILL